MRQHRGAVSSPPSAPPTSPFGAMAARCCSPTAASCGWRRSRSPMAAAPHCKPSSPDIRCGSKSLGPRDRYGRLVAFAFIGDDQQSVQQAMLEQGHARVSARVGDKECADTLLSAERAARAARRALWADPNFAPLSAENLTRLQAERGQFALVEGKVLSVRESGATIYVNFGRRWTRDFTVIILRRMSRAFTAAGIEPKKLEGHRIRVRGWLEQRGGPVITSGNSAQVG